MDFGAGDLVDLDLQEAAIHIEKKKKNKITGWFFNRVVFHSERIQRIITRPLINGGQVTGKLA